MYAERFYTYCEDLMRAIQRDEMENMARAADLIAAAVSNSHNFFIHDRGHLIGGELLARAGGASFVRRLDIAVPNPALMDAHTGARAASRARLPGEELAGRKRRFEADWIDYSFDINGIGEGDVLLLNSNSGFGYSATTIAETAKRKGVKLIVISSAEASGATTPESGGKKLSEYADIVFDNHAPFGDAAFEVAGLDEKLWPASGMGAVFIAWPLIIMTVEKLLSMGVKPTILRSANVPGGPEQNAGAAKRYEELGY